MASGRATAPGPRPGARLRASQWFALATAVLGVATVVGTVAGVVAILRLTEARELVVERLDPASTAAFQLSAALINEEAGVRGYAVGGDEAFLQPFHMGRRQEIGATRRLRRLVTGSQLRVVADDLAAASRAARAWRTQYAQPAILRIRATGAGSLEPATARTGRRLFDDVRDALERQRATIRSERTQGRRRLNGAATFLYGSFAAIAILLGAALTTAMIMLRRTVTLPLGALARRVRRVARGEFDRPVRSHGPRDVSELAADIDSMRMRILSELSAVRETHAQLDESARELERSNAELEQFAYVASHDLQEPLRKVASFCQLLEQRYRGQLDERADQYIEFAVDGAKRMQQLINDLLAFSRVGRISGDLAPLALGDPVRLALDNLSTAVEESGAAVDVGELPTVRGDRALLTLVFQNLVANAIKFRSTAAPAIRIESERRDGEWVVSCSDNGIGVDPEYAKRVFVIFQRLHAKNEYAGTGIGLAMCRKIVEYHGGRIWLDSDGRDTGTTIRLTLPALEEDR